MAVELSALETLQIRLAIEDLNSAFTHHLDHGEVDALVELFCVDALYTHGERRSNGRSEIARLFRDRAARVPPRTSRHLSSGLRIQVLSRSRAAGTSVCLTFAGDGPPPLPATPLLVADFVDAYALCDDGQWRIRERHIHRIFVAAANSGPVGLSKK